MTTQEAIRAYQISQLPKVGRRFRKPKTLSDFQTDISYIRILSFFLSTTQQGALPSAVRNFQKKTGAAVEEYDTATDEAKAVADKWNVGYVPYVIVAQDEKVLAKITTVQDLYAFFEQDSYTKK
ncbi:MAG: hypothetical protein LBU62_00010 [Bacteroidales bacterium]|jgi:hypothetical protein|nr:hypothetical protein [Bacteroidales bacterium]